MDNRELITVKDHDVIVDNTDVTVPSVHAKNFKQKRRRECETNKALLYGKRETQPPKRKKSWVGFAIPIIFAKKLFRFRRPKYPRFIQVENTEHLVAENDLSPLTSRIVHGIAWKLDTTPRKISHLFHALCRWRKGGKTTHFIRIIETHEDLDALKSRNAIRC